MRAIYIGRYVNLRHKWLIEFVIKQVRYKNKLGVSGDGVRRQTDVNG